MNKIRIIVKTRKVEIWNFLKGLKSLSECLVFGMLWLAIIFTTILTWAMTTDTYKLLRLFNEDILYLEVWGNLIYIPLKFCFLFWIINMISKLGMRIVAMEMDEEEKIKARIKSPIIKTVGVRLKTGVSKDNINKNNEDNCNGNS